MYKVVKLHFEVYVPAELTDDEIEDYINDHVNDSDWVGYLDSGCFTVTDRNEP